MSYLNTRNLVVDAEAVMPGNASDSAEIGEAEKPLNDQDFLLQVQKSARSIKAIRKAAKPPLEDHLAVGRYLHLLEREVPSTKLRYKRIMQEYPELLSQDTALRSNSKRLWEADNGLRDYDLFEVLGINDLHDLYTTNPTVIFSKYRKARKAE